LQRGRDPLYFISVNSRKKEHRSLRPTPKRDKFDLFYAALFICNVFLTTKHVHHLPLMVVMGLTYNNI
jgi:hypothetical protein